MNKQKNPAVTSRIKSFSKAGQLHAEFILEHCRFGQLLFEHRQPPDVPTKCKCLKRPSAK